MFIYLVSIDNDPQTPHSTYWEALEMVEFDLGLDIALVLLSGSTMNFDLNGHFLDGHGIATAADGEEVTWEIVRVRL